MPLFYEIVTDLEAVGQSKGKAITFHYPDTSAPAAARWAADIMLANGYTPSQHVKQRPNDTLFDSSNGTRQPLGRKEPLPDVAQEMAKK